MRTPRCPERLPPQPARGRTRWALGAVLPLAVALTIVTVGRDSPSTPAWAIGPSSRVALVQLLLPGQRAEPHPGLSHLSRALARRTNVSVRPGALAVSPGDSGVVRHPLLWTVTSRSLPPLPAPLAQRLGTMLRRGGTWVVDGPSAPARRAAFLASVRRAASRLLPGSPLGPVPSDHTLFKSFYLLAPDQIRERWGAVHVVARDRRATVIVVHGVAHALADPAAPPAEVEWQRRLAVNIVLYALCVDYKSDQVHAAAILRRRGRAPAPPRVGPSPHRAGGRP